MPRPFHAQTKLAADPDRFTDAQAAATASAVTGFRAVASEALLDGTNWSFQEASDTLVKALAALAATRRDAEVAKFQDRQLVRPERKKKKDLGTAAALGRAQTGKRRR